MCFVGVLALMPLLHTCILCACRIYDGGIRDVGGGGVCTNIVRFDLRRRSGLKAFLLLSYVLSYGLLVPEN